MDTPGFVGRIPVRNLWLLMLYASSLWRERGTASVAVEKSPDKLPDLVAEILAHAVEKRLRRMLHRGYRQRRAVLTRVRGRIDLLATERRQLLWRGRVACRFEEPAVDTPRNRFVRGACEQIAGLVSSSELRWRCRRAATAMRALGVVGAAPTRREMRTETLGRHEADDRQMVAAASLALDLALPTEDSGSQRLFRPNREERWARRLFEQAARGFYEVVLAPRGWSVGSRNIDWQVERTTYRGKVILPGMTTDITLDHRSECRRIVVDTKFTMALKKNRYGQDKLRSGHLRQIYAYVFSQIRTDDPLSGGTEGVLLYPVVDQRLDEAVLIQGHRFRFLTVDLGGDASVIRADLLRLIKPMPGTWRE